MGLNLQKISVLPRCPCSTPHPKKPPPSSAMKPFSISGSLALPAPIAHLMVRSLWPMTGDRLEVASGPERLSDGAADPRALASAGSLDLGIFHRLQRHAVGFATIVSRTFFLYAKSSSELPAMITKKPGPCTSWASREHGLVFFVAGGDVGRDHGRVEAHHLHGDLALADLRSPPATSCRVVGKL